MLLISDFYKIFGTDPTNTGFRSIGRRSEYSTVFDYTMFSGTLLHGTSISRSWSSCLSVQSIKSDFFKIQCMHFSRISIIISQVFKTPLEYQNL